MAKMSKGELLARANCERVQTDYYNMHEALSAVIAGERIRLGQFTCNDWTVTAWLINPDRAHGGLVMIEQRPSKASKCTQSPDYTVHYLETYYRDMSASGSTSDWRNELLCLLSKAQQIARQSVSDTANTN